MLLVNEEGTTHEGCVDDHPLVSHYDRMCNLFGESLLMALEAQANRITNSTATKKLGKDSKESSEVPSGVMPAATPVGGEVKSIERYPVEGFNRTAQRLPITKLFGRAVFFPVYKKPTLAAVNVLECGIKRHKSLDISRAVVQKGKVITRSKQNSVIKTTPLPLGSLTL